MSGSAGPLCWRDGCDRPVLGESNYCASHQSVSDEKEPAAKERDWFELMFKRDLFQRLYAERVNDAAFCWMLVQKAWEAKPEDC